MAVWSPPLQVPVFQRVEVREDEAVDQLLRGGLHPAAPLQHPPHCQVIRQPAQTIEREGEEGIRQVQRYQTFKYYKINFMRLFYNCT